MTGHTSHAYRFLLVQLAGGSRLVCEVDRYPWLDVPPGARVIARSGQKKRKNGARPWRWAVHNAERSLQTGGQVKSYLILRTDHGLECWIMLRGKRHAMLPHCLCHSPTGFDCGSSGSGPADLALSILMNFFAKAARAVPKGNTLVWRRHQAFKEHFIAPTVLKPGEGRTITSGDIRLWLTQQEQQEQTQHTELFPEGRAHQA